MRSSKLKTFLLATCAVIMAASLMIFPKEALEASTRGVTMWWEVVFPSLLPFFIISELLIGFGVVTYIGALLEPFMRPLFRVPGVGGFVWAMGLATGYPAGAKLTARLRQEKKLSRIEAERLVSFTNSSNPLFIFGAIAVGFFHNAALGIVLALSHYLGNFCVGLMMRFHGTHEHKNVLFEKKKRTTFKGAFQLLHEERIKDGRPIGKLLGDAIQSSVHTLLMIGGFIILFSVLNKVLTLLEITTILASIFAIFLALFQLPAELNIPFISGLFEITLGSQMAAQIENIELLHQMIIVSFILAFNGFSVQAQVASILAETDIRFKPYFFARITHGFLAAFFTIILWKPLYLQQTGNEDHGATTPVFLQEQSWTWVINSWHSLLDYGPMLTLCAFILYIFVRFYRTVK